MDKREILRQLMNDMGVGVEETVIDKGDKQLIMAMTYEFVILIIKLSSTLKELDALEKEQMDHIQDAVCKLQSLIGKVIDVNKDDIYEGLKMATENNGNDLDDNIAEMMVALHKSPLAEG